MTPEGLLPCPQESTTWHYPQPDQSKLSQPSSLRSILILPSHPCLGLLSGLPLLDFLYETLSGCLLPIWPTWPSISHPAFLLVWAPCHFFLFQECNSSKRGIIYRMSLTFKNSHWKTYMWFHNVSSSGTAICVRNMGPSALTLKGAISYGEHKLLTIIFRCSFSFRTFQTPLCNKINT